VEDRQERKKSPKNQAKTHARVRRDFREAAREELRAFSLSRVWKIARRKAEENSAF